MSIGSDLSGGVSTIGLVNRERFIRICAGFVVALAVSLPWSTSATGVLAALSIIALALTSSREALLRVLLTPSGAIPVLLWALGVLGMLWADVPLAERVDGVNSFHKLLVIPLLMIYFRHSARESWVIVGFLLSCTVLLVVSWTWFFFPNHPWPVGKAVGIPVKDYTSQSAVFIVCIATFLDLALIAWRQARMGMVAAYVFLALAFLANILFIATSRTALIIVPVVLLLFGFKRFSWKGVAGIVIVLAVTGAAAWPFSTYLRTRVTTFADEVKLYRSENAQTPAGERLEFWKKSFTFVTEAPLIGHGTGTIREMFRRAATGVTGASSEIAANPHNQTFAVAIQLGLVGVFALYAMWIAHLLLFRGEGLAAWIGLVVVVHNIVGSLFNSHLFDFTQGWGYVIGVGVAGGVVLRNELRSDSG